MSSTTCSTPAAASTLPKLPASRPKLAKKSLAATISPPARAHGAKKAIQALDTNLNSYDRTDPFFAFNTLIKLLGSLPSRIGGCQFKLTPDEHKLSLHLLNIVEPFVGLAPSRRTITRQPTEVLDAIIFHVDSRKDLLSLALSCHRMHDVVSPRHLDYRNIRCKVSSISVWNHLIVNRSLARNVRKLEIMDERSKDSELVPRHHILASDTDLESTDDELGLHEKQERYLVSALSKMTALASFAWSCNHSPISIDNVWPVLLKHQSLQELEINDNLVFSNIFGAEERKPRRQIVLPEMITMSLRSTPHVYGSTKQPNLTRISEMLNHCPNLRSLNISYTPPRTTTNAGPRPPADDLLLYGRWTHLTSLTLTNVRCSSTTTSLDTLSAFLSAHRNLEILHLDIGPLVIPSTTPHSHSTSRFTLQPNSLPRLRELHANKELATAVLSCPHPLQQPRPLETLKGIRLSGTLTHDAAFLSNLKQCGKYVKRIELIGWNEMEDIRRLVEYAPTGLTWLDVGRRGAASVGAGAGVALRDRGANATVVTNTMEWAMLLSELPDLVAFHGVRFFFEVSGQAVIPGVTASSAHISMTDKSRIRKNDEVAAVLAWKCEKLRRLDHWERGSGKVIVLVRDVSDRMSEKEKARWEVRRVKV